MRTLTIKQTRFCQEIVSGQTLSEAYRVAFAPKTMSNKTINEKACRLAKMGKIGTRITELQAPVVAKIRGTLEDRLAELAHAMFLDPVACFDAHGRPLSIREMPEHVRRAIASYEVDPGTFVTRIKFVEKRGAIMAYSKLVGDIPREKSPVAPPSQRHHDLSKLTDDEFNEYLRMKKKTLVEEPDPSDRVRATS